MKLKAKLLWWTHSVSSVPLVLHYDFAWEINSCPKAIAMCEFPQIPQRVVNTMSE